MTEKKDAKAYDVIVVGAGPAGSMTALTLAKLGVNVLLLDRKTEIGVPDKCGEFVPSLDEMKNLSPRVKNLENIFNIPSHCIVNRTKFIKFSFPNKEVEIPFQGIVLERKIFDKHLANEAARAGAEITAFAKVTGLLDKGEGVRVRTIDGVKDIYSKIVVAADGAYSLLARQGGLPVSQDPLDYGVGYHYEMVGVDHDPDYVDMYIGEDIAPGTYAWIIPKGADVANVGTGVRASYMKKGLTVRDYQNNFTKKHAIVSKKLLRAQATAVKAGCIPVGGPMERTNTDNMVAVGDAAGHTIPTVGGGIPPALICGRLAGQAIAQSLLNGSPLQAYDSAWREQLGTTLQNSLRIRRMSDVVFKNTRIIDFATKKGWLTEEMIMKFVLCQMDAKMKLMESTLNLMKSSSPPQ